MNEPSYPADLYAAVHVGTPGDADFYRGVCEGASSVLELGCGYGRILAALDAPVLVGVEQDPALLEMAKKRMNGRAALIEGDMRELALGERFDAVIAPYSTLYCLTSEADLLRSLDVVKSHLADGGVFAFDVWYADDFHESADPNEPAEYEPLGHVDVDGVSWAVEERADWDRSAQKLVVDYRHTPEAGGAPRHGRIVHRYVLEAELQGLLERAGLSVVESGRVETEDGESLAVVAAVGG